MHRAGLRAVAILFVLDVVAGKPAQIPLLAVAILAAMAMMVTLAWVTAGLTNSLEHTQVSTLLVSLSVIAVAGWVGITSSKDLALLKADESRRLDDRAGRRRLQRRRPPRRLAAPVGDHPGLGRRRRRTAGRLSRCEPHR